MDEKMQRFTTPGGTVVEFIQEAQGEAAVVRTPEGGTLEFREEGKKITIYLGAEASITLDKDNLTLESRGKLILKSALVQVEGSILNLNGDVITLKARGPLNIDGAILRLN